METTNDETAAPADFATILKNDFIQSKVRESMNHQ